VSNIKGKVNELFEAKIFIEFIGNENITKVSIDTSFNGDLVLPLNIITALGLKSLYRMEIELV
jgi:predicted aspartyl protease